MREPRRDLSVDLYRVLAVIVVVLGHWLAASLTYRGGQFGDQNVLAGLPWTQWLTLLFQVIPVFFLVAGYGNAASWSRYGDAHRWEDWIRRRVTATLGPTTLYVSAVLAAVAAIELSGADRSQLAYGASAVALHLWFLPVYLVLVSLTPAMLAAQRRWGLAAPAALTVAVAAVDAATLGAHLPVLGWANYLLGWATVYQLGVAWFSGTLSGPRPLLLTAGALVALTILVRLELYPLSMVAVPGAPVRNTSPPTLALLAFSAAQAGLLLALAPALARRLRTSRGRPLLATANRNVMALYLWHMIPVVFVAAAVYPTRLLPQPALGTAGWWLVRIPWVGLLTAVTVAGLTLFGLAHTRSRHRRPARSFRVPPTLARLTLLLGTATAAYALFRFTTAGFAPAGRFPLTSTLLYATGAGFVHFTRAGGNDPVERTRRAVRHRE
ncbi:acyltransferase family protein [Amycolatopsis benzoatilytica]|uniref:acyltransferase family protein n=1 Tax=Amycolatopsis benzoatilytica TaxID=346045 RepID=UPI00037F616B|nr:acyltransferase [Amycolatopsis benzoatilytica]